MTENKTRKIEDLTPEEWQEIGKHYAQQFAVELKAIRDLVQVIINADDLVALHWFVNGTNRLIEDAKKIGKISRK